MILVDVHRRLVVLPEVPSREARLRGLRLRGQHLSAVQNVAPAGLIIPGVLPVDRGLLGGDGVPALFLGHGLRSGGAREVGQLVLVEGLRVLGGVPSQTT